MATVVYVDNPLQPQRRRTVALRRATTIRRHLRRQGIREFARPTVCVVNGTPVLRRDWASRRIAKDDVVAFVALPAGGRGGSNPLMIVIMVAMMVAMPQLGLYLTPLIGAFAASVVTAVVAVAIMGVMSVLIPPPKPKKGGYGDTSTSSPTYSLQTQGNVARLGQPIPVLYGRHQIFPDFATRPYGRFANNEQFLHYLLGVTQGECEIEIGRIGETPAANFTEVQWQRVPPGDAVPEAIADSRVVTCPDIGDAELVGSEAGSPWRGPFPINPPGTAILSLEVDVGAPRGLYYANDSGGLDEKSFALEIEVRPINGAGVATGDWIALDGIEKTGRISSPLRWTETFGLDTAGRYEARLRRTDEKDVRDRAGHAVSWFGLRGVLTTARTFPGLTTVAVKMQATNNLTQQSSQQFNVIATRKLRTWDAGAGAMTVGTFATRSLCDAFADACLADYGAGLSEGQVDLAGLYANHAAWEAAGKRFDAVFDQNVPAYEALARIARQANAVPIVQGGKVRLVRDEPTLVPVAMFTARNIVKGSFRIDYRMADDETADAVTVEYMDAEAWKPAEVTVALPGSTAAKPVKVSLFGCADRQQARAFGWYLASVNRYRRRLVSWRCEMEGLALLYGDPVSVSHDLPNWGLGADVVAFDVATRIATLSEPADFGAGGAHLIGLRSRTGELHGPYDAIEVPGDPYRVQLGVGDLPDIAVDGAAERTQAAFGPATTWAARLRVVAVRPRSDTQVEVVAVDDDPRVFEPVPAEEG